MYCPNCGEKNESQTQFCTKCQAPLETLVKEQARSKTGIKMLLAFVIGIAIFGLVMIFITKDPNETIQQQLTALRENQITEAYYNFTSKPFQASVSLEKFRQFVKENPVFLETKAISIGAHHIENQVSFVEAFLSTPDGTSIRVEYQLILEGDKWKILSIQPEETKATEQQTTEKKVREGILVMADEFFVSNEEDSLFDLSEISEILPSDSLEDAEATASGFDKNPLFQPIQQQLHELRQGNYEKAYKDYTSTSFQKATSPKAFVDFVETHPAFYENQSLKLDQVEPGNKNTAKISGTLSTKKGHSYPIEYSIVFENEAWKILHIEVSAVNKQGDTTEAAQLAGTKSLQFSKFVLGTFIDSKGIVSNPSRKFTPNSGAIHLNLYVQNAKAGAEVEVILQHDDSLKKAPESYGVVTTDGYAILSFAFSPPMEGWPVGKYRITAKSSTGVNSEIGFKVE